MKVAIIGAGPAGLAMARHCLEQGFQFDIFEQTGKVGGTWNYTDFVDVDENGYEVHSSIYEGLRTNTPKELMQYEDYNYPAQEKSYIDHPEVLQYIQSYAKKFLIIPHVKFYKKVLLVDPLPQNKWSIDVMDTKTTHKENYRYDAVIVCNGHYRDGLIPNMKGLDTFRGNYKHSCDYRKASVYKGKKVMVVGMGPSGSDLCRLLVTHADKVYGSHNPETLVGTIPAGTISKPLVKELRGYDAIFEDGTTERIDEIIFCTGYNYAFPFLSKNCKIESGPYVRPLYKQLINIEYPTMAFIGLPALVCCFPEFDLQARFVLATLSGHYTLPSKDEMMADYQKDLDNLNGQPLKNFHVLGERQEEYFEDLAETAKVKRIPPVINKLYARVRPDRNLNDCFKLIDNENYIQIR